jgi:hypothetical protein
MGLVKSRELFTLVGREKAHGVYRFRDSSPLAALTKASGTRIIAALVPRLSWCAEKNGRRQIGLTRLCLLAGCRVNEIGADPNAKKSFAVYNLQLIVRDENQPISLSSTIRRLVVSD